MLAGRTVGARPSPHIVAPAQAGAHNHRLASLSGLAVTLFCRTAASSRVSAARPGAVVSASGPRYRCARPGYARWVTTLVAKSGDACATVPDRQSPARPAIDAGNSSKNLGRSQVSPDELRRVCPFGRSKPCPRSRHQIAWHQRLLCRSKSRSSCSRPVQKHNESDLRAATEFGPNRTMGRSLGLREAR